MRNRPPADPDPELLPESVVAPLLARASELDATRAARLEVAALRAAATEAGISAHAFDTALAELRGAERAEVADVAARPRRRARRWTLAAMVAALATGTFAVSRLVPGQTPVGPGPPMVEETLLLQCLSPGEAIALIGPHLRLPSNTVIASPEHAPRVITIRATPTQMREVKAVLDRYEGAGSPACATGGA